MGNKSPNMSGQKYGMLTLIKKVGFKQSEGKDVNRRYAMYLCKCTCGNYKILVGKEVKRGKVKSCGCYRRFHSPTLIKKTHGDYGTEFYKFWIHLKYRCNNPNSDSYRNYGGRGIKHDPKWKEYEEFKKDMYFKYLFAKYNKKVKKPSIERLDVNGDYCKDNCIFIELKDQGNNRRTTKYFRAINPDGKIYIDRNVIRFAKKFGLRDSNIYSVLNSWSNSKSHYGWRFEYI